jgi:hypothetical protein
MSSRQQRTRQAKTKAQKEIDRILVEESIDEEAYYNAINVRSAVKPESQPSKITLKECKTLYEKEGFNALFPFEVNKHTKICVIYDILNLIEKVSKNRFGWYYNLSVEQQRKAKNFYSGFDTRALNYIYNIIDDTRSYIEDLM